MKNLACPIGLLTVIFMILFIIFMKDWLIPLETFHDYHVNDCYINRIDYPITIPTYQNTNNWIECDCGRNCITWYPCVNLYSNISKEQYLKEDYYFSKDDKCTFSDDDCLNGENMQTIDALLNNSKLIYEKYINTTIPCYYDDDITNIYMYKDWDNVTFISLIVGVIISLFCCIGCILIDSEVFETFKCCKKK